MYEHRFGLHRKPFQSNLTENDFFESETHREIIPAMLHALKSDLGVAVLTGPAGCGKTVTAEYVRRLLQADSQTVFLRGGAVRSSSALLHALHRSLKTARNTDDSDGAEDVVNNVRRWDILERLQRVCDFWGPVVVLLDDAHLVEPEVFTELRALLEEEMEGRKLLRLLITGPLSLEETLAQPTMTDFAQRIRTHVFLQPLRSDESVRYLDLQISNSGGALGKIFEPMAVERITAAADGSPRCLSLLADECLVVSDELASRQQTQSGPNANSTDTPENTPNARVSGDVVTEALQRLQHLPYAWNASAYVEEEEDHEPVPVVESTDKSFSPAHSSSADGVIEIGSSSESPSPISSPSPAAPTSSASSGVVEIGFAEPLTHHAAVETVADSFDTYEKESGNTTPTPPPATDDLYEPSDLPEGTIEIGSAEFFDRTSEYPEFDPDVSLNGGADDGTLADDHVEEPATADIATQQDTAGYSIAYDEPADVAATASGEHDTELTASSQSLEHHLVLAGAIPPEGRADEKDIAATTGMPATASQAQPTAPLFSHFSRWEPAGTWPAPLVLGGTESTLQTTPSNTEPVFDRYTWCELGRAVSPDQVQQTRLPEPSITPVWPPDITGVAPPASIPIIECDEAQTEHLTESTKPCTVPTIAVSPVIDIDAPLPNLEAEFLDQSFDYIQQMIEEAASPVSLNLLPLDEPTADPAEDISDDDAGWVDGQLMKEFESVEQPPENGGPTDEVCMNIAQPITDADAMIELPSDDAELPESEQQAVAFLNDAPDDSEEQILLPISDRLAASASRATGQEDQESDVDTPVSTEMDRLLTLPYRVDEIEQNEQSARPSDAPTAAGAASVDNGEPKSAHRASTGSNSPGNTLPPRRPVTSLPGDRQTMVQGRNENAQIGHREDGYTPQLLHQARDRVVSITPPQEMLRPAAGAESVALPVPEAVIQENTGNQDLLRISTMCDSSATEQQAGSSSQSERSAEPRFAQLFTRLRQRRTSGS